MKKLMLLLSFFATSIFLCGNELRIEEIKNALCETLDLDKQFHLYEELFTLQINEYKTYVEDVNIFRKEAEVAMKNASLRKNILLNFSEDELAIFNSYKNLIDLAQALNYKISYFCMVSPSEIDNSRTMHIEIQEHRAYFLDILELERTLNFHILGSTNLIYCEIITINDILDRFYTLSLVGILNGVLKEHRFEKEGMNFREVEFYWNYIFPTLEKILYNLENQWKDIDFDSREALLPIVLLKYAHLIPCKDPNINFIERVLPYILKQKNLNLLLYRFNEIYADLETWEKNYQWFKLHLKAYELSKSKGLEGAEEFFKKAEDLSKSTLNTPFFSFKKSKWKDAKAHALELLEFYKEKDLAL